MPRLAPPANPVTIELEGEQFQACAGEPVAAALVAEGETIFSRSPKYHRPRGPFCMSGACAHCLMRVDGVPNVPTCRVPVKSGMRLERQNAIPDARLDVFRANDFVFRDWFNHHEFLAGVPIVEKVLQKIARQLAGLGTLPDKPAPDRPPATVEKLGIVIVGAGAAGLAAAKVFEARRVPYTLFERDAEVGGRLIGAAEVGQPAPWNAPARTHANVAGLFADDGPPFLAIIEHGALKLVFYEKLILANGGYPQLPTFPNNDLPGVMAGRAVATLIRRWGVLAGKTVACVGEPNEARALAELVKNAGGTAVAIGEEPLRAHGLREVTAVTTNAGKRDCDVIATCVPQSPAFELARAAGAKVSWSSSARCFVVEADAVGRTSQPNLFVAGELRGPMSSAAAAEQGLAVADHLCAGATP
ncbi:MAG: 2Fe-2S iron-sulfur cluster-binding protein [Myxococcaceae bacterium]